MNINVKPVLQNPSCEPYSGTACKKYLKNDYVYIAANATQSTLESKLTEAFKVISHSSDLSETCAKFVKPTLCYSVLPLCKSVKFAEPELICRKDCEMLENDICRLEYAIAKRHKLLGQVITLSDCSFLPESNCRLLGLPVPIPPNKNEKCYENNGKNYHGEVSETISGQKCVPWNQVQMRTADYRELLGGHNFCRNPDQSSAKPWCYTYDNNKELCKIQQCGNVDLVYSALALCGLLLILLLFICTICIQRRSKKKMKLLNQFKMVDQRSNITKIGSDNSSDFGDSKFDVFPFETASLTPTLSSSQISERRHKITEFNFFNIKFEEELGEGAFGKVYRGEVTLTNGEKMLVAVKTLKENANSRTVSEFKREVKLMSELRHPNIISLLGICMTNRLCMLFEFMSHGDLHEYLITHNPNQNNMSISNELILKNEDLLNIAVQIAAGMEYLCSKHFVHRDLATRNCLVGDNLTVKISDFGLSRDVYSSDYYRVQKSALLPIRWMSPESILYGKFTVESDIWSFGVVLWEIYSYGLQPYYSHSNQDVVDMIRSRQILSCPEDCPSHMYTLMIKCWSQIPSQRPNFSEIHSYLLQLKDIRSNNTVSDCTYLSDYVTNRALYHEIHSYSKTS